jgi:UDP:flavonoid glycosyltransferase YjiC (YdhE family)
MPLAHLRAQVGLPTDPDGHMAYRYLHLCFTPRRWDGPAATFPDSARFFRHANAVRPGETPPAWLDELTGRPVVLVSLGTVFHRTPGLYEHILEALRDEPIDLILAVGRDQDPTRFGPQPPNVRIERYLPLPHLLPRCALFVTHGVTFRIKWRRFLITG